MNNLEKAIDLDIHLVSEYPACRQITEQLFEEIAAAKNIRKRGRAKETLKLVVLNLWVSAHTGLPIKYSRDKNKYNLPHRYGKLHIRYTLLFNAINALEELGYLKHKIGFFDRSKEFGRESRFWPTQKMIDRFTGFEADRTRVIKRTRPMEIIQLKDDDKVLVEYQDKRSIEEMRFNLQCYNHFIGQQRLEVVAPAEDMVNFHFLKKLELDVMKGLVEFNRVQLQGTPIIDTAPGEAVISAEDLDLILAAAPNNIEVSGHPVIIQSTPTNSHIINHIVQSSHGCPAIPNITFLDHLYTMTKALRSYLIDFTEFDMPILNKYPLSFFGMNGLDFRWTYPYLHRVFNKGSFRLGGRFFGGYHLELPRGLRRRIRINGEPTVEADYAALHIRMLYHLEGIDYRADPYIEVCDSPSDRKIYKLVLLIAINAENETKAIQAIRRRLREEKVFGGLTDRSIIRRIDRFKSVHPRVAKYLNTGIGRRLQNLDSRITDIILKEATQRQIPCLPVHDSYIVPRREEEFLMEAIMKAYRTVMKGFDPEIEIKH